jgi:hypothetical protein
LAGNPCRRIAGFSFRRLQFAQNEFVSNDYQLVQLASGAKTLFSVSYGEKMHPGLGPQAEAELLYVRQLKIHDRLKNHPGEFVIWDVGLGAAANAIAALRATRDPASHWNLRGKMPACSVIWPATNNKLPNCSG